LSLAEIKNKTGAGPEMVVDYLIKAVRANPEDAKPRLAMVNFYLSNKQVPKALSAAQDAVASLPDDPALLDALGRAQQASGDINNALLTYNKLTGLVPNSPQPYLRMAELHVANHSKEEAIRSLQKGLETSPQDIPLKRGLILLYLDAGKANAANDIVRDLQKKNPKDATGYVFEADIAAARKAWPDAASAYRVALKLQPSTEIASKLHLALISGGKSSDAERFANSWLAEHPTDGRFRLFLAESATARRDYPAAAKQYEDLLQSQPNSPILLNNLAWVTGQMKGAKALEYAQKANKLAPNQPVIMDTYAVLLADSGDTGQALQVLQKAVELAPDAADIKLNLAKVQIKAGKPEAARKTLGELASLGEKLPAQSEVQALLKGLH
jgi:putative PEP-CTERM system TPR-repeat lipoprotein